MTLNILTIPLKVCFVILIWTVGIVTFKLFHAVIVKTVHRKATEKPVHGKPAEKSATPNADPIVCVHRAGRTPKPNEPCTCTGVISGVVIKLSHSDKIKLFHGHSQIYSRLEDTIHARLTGVETSENPEAAGGIEVLLKVTSSSSDTHSDIDTSDSGSFTLPEIRGDSLNATCFDERLPGFGVFSRRHDVERRSRVEESRIWIPINNSPQLWHPPINVSPPISVIPEVRISTFMGRESPIYGRPNKRRGGDSPSKVHEEQVSSFASVNPHRCFPHLKNSVNGLLQGGEVVWGDPDADPSRIAPTVQESPNGTSNVIIQRRSSQLDNLMAFSSGSPSTASSMTPAGETEEAILETFNIRPTATPRRSLIACSAPVPLIPGFENSHFFRNEPDRNEFSIDNPETHQETAQQETNNPKTAPEEADHVKPTTDHTLLDDNYKSELLSTLHLELLQSEILKRRPPITEQLQITMPDAIVCEANLDYPREEADVKNNTVNEGHHNELNLAIVPDYEDVDCSLTTTTIQIQEPPETLPTVHIDDSEISRPLESSVEALRRVVEGRRVSNGSSSSSSTYIMSENSIQNF